MVTPKSKPSLGIKKTFSPRSSFSTREYFGRLRETVKLPHLIESQLRSYSWFTKEGLRELLDEISPINDWTGKDLKLEFLDYHLDESKYDEKISRERNTSYEAPLRCRVRLTNKRTGEVKEQAVFLGDFPLITERGTFVINGIERVVVSQLIRSPGVFFTAQNISGRNFFGAKIIPNRGAWLEIETDSEGVIGVKIDRKRKVPVTALLRAFGYSRDEEILELFKDVETGEIKYIKKTLAKDPSHSQGEGLIEVYKRIRPGDMATVDNAKQMIEGMFFRFDRYDFGQVGRYKMNQRLGTNYPLEPKYRAMQKEDLILTLKNIIRLNNDPKAKPDDIDHLGNRRVRTSGELIQNKLRIGLTRMERIVKDRMSTLDINIVTPAQLINSRPLTAAIKEFFSSSQLSQFMDQVNPLAELEHKRRLSAMGPGGLARERAGFEVRDVHPSHYGRICPIQTPEGPNIGLIGHMACYAKINECGFLETPYRRVKNGQLTNEIIYLDALAEDKLNIAHAGIEVDPKGRIVGKEVQARIHSQPGTISRDKIDYIDVSPVSY
ncbi:MAG TPA: DNA-directed RNA polymerase subunit beta, partial [Candidatus Portnoybacteria bacterium]|nr:DNA-directed RNA polymerase subunit beta [Candidatus Portnoybacteria bacterium]